MKRNNQKMMIALGIVIILSFILIYVGQFLFSQKDPPKGKREEVIPDAEPVEISAQPTDFPVRYKHISTEINRYKQEIFMLEFDPFHERIEFKPVLAYGNIFGFEKISEIMRKKEAYAAINAGFFFEFGNPVGMVAVDGELLAAATGYSSVLLITESKIAFREMKTEIAFVHGEQRRGIDGINTIGEKDGIILYTPEFGSTNRAKIENTSVFLEDNIIMAVQSGAEPVKIKKNSRIISFFGEKAAMVDGLGLKVGDRIAIEIKPEIQGKYHAYECGSMLVKDGENVAPDRDRWVGTLQSRDPRTAVGIKEDGNVVLLVVDGRQPGYSTGFTGKELADYLLSIGVKDAAMLDGGATSQMHVEGVLKNRPSDRGLERPVGGALAVFVRQ